MPAPGPARPQGLESHPPGDEVTAACTDPLARIDIPNLLTETGDRLEAVEEDEGVLLFRIRKSPFRPTSAQSRESGS